MLLQEFSEKMFEVYKEINTLTLIINNLNTGSRLYAGKQSKTYPKKNVKTHHIGVLFI